MSNQNKFSNDMSIEERHKLLFEMSDDEIDYSDIPEIDDKVLARTAFLKRIRNKQSRRNISHSKGAYVVILNPRINKDLNSRDHKLRKLVKSPQFC